MSFKSINKDQTKAMFLDGFLRKAPTFFQPTQHCLCKGMMVKQPVFTFLGQPLYSFLPEVGGGCGFSGDPVAAGRLPAGQRGSKAADLLPHILGRLWKVHLPVINQVLDSIAMAPALAAPPAAIFALFRPSPEPIIAATKGTGAGIFTPFGSGDPFNHVAISL
jgi:hypothetical protein